MDADVIDALIFETLNAVRSKLNDVADDLRDVKSDIREINDHLEAFRASR